MERSSFHTAYVYIEGYMADSTALHIAPEQRYFMTEADLPGYCFIRIPKAIGYNSMSREEPVILQHGLLLDTFTFSLKYWRIEYGRGFTMQMVLCRWLLPYIQHSDDYIEILTLKLRILIMFVEPWCNM